MEVRRLREPTYRVVWEGKDVTRDISPYVLSIHYTDYASGKSDSIEIAVEDKDDLWKTFWYPRKGDVLEVWIGYKGEQLLRCGRFEIDEIEFEGPPDVARMYGISMDVKKSLRQRNTEAWENTTLSEICEFIARKHGLKPVLWIDPDIKIIREDQSNEGDIYFLKKLAGKYGYIVKVAEEKLFVLKERKLEEQPPALTLDRGFCLRFSFRDQLREIYRGVMVKYFDPRTDMEFWHFEPAPGIVKGDVYKLNERVETEEQARERAKGALKRLNKWQIEGEIDLTGMQQVCAGINILLKGFGNLDGKHFIEESRHNIDRERGYTTMIRVRKVGQGVS